MINVELDFLPCLRIIEPGIAKIAETAWPIIFLIAAIAPEDPERSFKHPIRRLQIPILERSILEELLLDGQWQINETK